MDSFNRRSSNGASLASVYRLDTGLVQNAPNAGLSPELWRHVTKVIVIHICSGIGVFSDDTTPTGTRRNNNVIMASKRRHDVVSSS